MMDAAFHEDGAKTQITPDDPFYLDNIQVPLVPTDCEEIPFQDGVVNPGPLPKMHETFSEPRDWLDDVTDGKPRRVTPEGAEFRMPFVLRPDASRPDPTFWRDAERGKGFSALRAACDRQCAVMFADQEEKIAARRAQGARIPKDLVPSEDAYPFGGYDFANLTRHQEFIRTRNALVDCCALIAEQAVREAEVYFQALPPLVAVEIINNVYEARRILRALPDKIRALAKEKL